MVLVLMIHARLFSAFEFESNSTGFFLAGVGWGTEVGREGG